MKNYFLIFIGLVAAVLCFAYFSYQRPASALDADYNFKLAKQLDSIYQLDQGQRMRIDSFRTAYGPVSTELKNLFMRIAKQDTSSLALVTHILDTYGWLGRNKIGENGNRALYMLVAHAPFKIKEKYLPLMRDAAKKGNAEPSDMAAMEDEVLIDQGKKQLYGTILFFDEDSKKHFVVPLEDPLNVDKRRLPLGLISMSEYLNLNQSSWNAQQYIMDLPFVEAKWKSMNTKYH